jgi:hypothetical protein
MRPIKGLQATRPRLRAGSLCINHTGNQTYRKVRTSSTPHLADQLGAAVSLGFKRPDRALRAKRAAGLEAC